MDDKKWQGYLHKMPYEYNDRGPNGPINFSAEDHCLPISSMNLKVLERCTSVVDLGCGVGRAMDLLKRQGKKVRGVTFNPAEIRGGIEKYGLTSEEIMLGDIHETPFADEEFDGAISWESLEHAISPIIVLWECYRILQPFGKLLLFLPNKVYVDADVHIINLNIEQTRALLTKANFRIDDIVDYTGDSARYVATKLATIDNKENLKQHNNAVPIRHWTDLVAFGG